MSDLAQIKKDIEALTADAKLKNQDIEALTADAKLKNQDIKALRADVENLKNRVNHISTLFKPATDYALFETSIAISVRPFFSATVKTKWADNVENKDYFDYGMVKFGEKSS